jgi:YVTN family beta-propeller protein
MSASGDDQPTRKRRRLVPIPVVTGVLAVIGAVVLAVVLSGCRGAPSAGPTYRVTATVRVGKLPDGVAVDPGTHTAYVVNYGDNTVAVIDASTRTVTATVPVGKRPIGVAVDPGTHTVYVTNLDDATVSVIDASTRTVTATVPVGKIPYGVAVDPGTHTGYVTNRNDGTVSVIESRSGCIGVWARRVGCPIDSDCELYRLRGTNGSTGQFQAAAKARNTL